MKNKTKMFSVNLQQGFIIDSHNSNIFAAYSHNLKTVLCKVPWTRNDFEIPASLEKYILLSGLTDSFSLTAYTNSGQKDLFDVIIPALKLKKYNDIEIAWAQHILDNVKLKDTK